MFRSTISAAALALLLAAAGQATAADKMSEKDYADAIEKCKDAESSAQRDDCLADAQDRFQQSKLNPDAADDDKDLSRQIEDKLPDSKIRDDVGGSAGGGRRIKDKVPDKLD